MSHAPVLLAQITDPHVELPETDGGASAEALETAVAALGRLPTPPHAVVVTGDLVNDPSPGTYGLVRDLLEPISVPLMVLPGNHDERSELRAVFPEAEGTGGDPYRWTRRVGGLRVIGLDTTIPGSVEGRLDPDALRWLDEALTDDADRPAILALHHPPSRTGVAEMDSICLRDGDCAALAEVLERHPAVKRLICGHVHQTTTAAIAGRPVFTCASTHLQLPLTIPGAELRLVPAPPVIGVHVLLGGEVTSHVQPVV